MDIYRKGVIIGYVIGFIISFILLEIKIIKTKESFSFFNKIKTFGDFILANLEVFVISLCGGFAGMIISLLICLFIENLKIGIIILSVLIILFSIKYVLYNIFIKEK